MNEKKNNKIHMFLMQQLTFNSLDKAKNVYKIYCGFQNINV